MSQFQPITSVSLRQHDLGFTIIEIMVTIVVAGLILFIIFDAIPALQRNSRNTRRVHDATTIVAAIQDCLDNTGHNKPYCADPTHLHLAVSELVIFNGVIYGSSSYGSGSAVPPTTDKPNYLFGLVCNASGTWFTSARGGDTFVVTYQVESASSPLAYRCIDGG